MAGEDLLGLLGSNDLGAFNQSVLQSDPYGMAGRSLQAWTPDASTWSPGATAATAFGKSFLAGLLGNYAQQNAADQTNAVISVLPQLKSDPLSVMAPEGVDAAPFANLKASAILKSYVAQEQQAQAQNKFDSDLLARLMGKKNEVIGEAQGKAAIYGPNSADPTSPDYKIEQDKLKAANDKVGIERQLANDFANSSAKFKERERGMKALTEAYMDPAGTSDFEIIRRGAQAVEEGLAVKLDDERSLQGAATVLGMSVASVKAAISGESKLTPEVRAGIMRIAKRAYDPAVSDYNTIRENFLTRAKAAQLAESSVVPYGASRSFQELYPDLNISAGLTEGGAQTVTVTNPKTGKSFQVPANDPRLKMLQTQSQGTPYG